MLSKVYLPGSELKVAVKNQGLIFTAFACLCIIRGMIRLLDIASAVVYVTCCIPVIQTLYIRCNGTPSNVIHPAFALDTRFQLDFHKNEAYWHVDYKRAFLRLWLDMSSSFRLCFSAEQSNMQWEQSTAEASQILGFDPCCMLPCGWWATVSPYGQRCNFELLFKGRNEPMRAFLFGGWSAVSWRYIPDLSLSMIWRFSRQRHKVLPCLFGADARRLR